MKATFDGTRVKLGKEGVELFEKSGYGRKEKGGIRLAPEEALYLLYRRKITITDYDFDSLLAEFTETSHFFRRFLVYRDIRERGYVIQPGPHDFRVFRRGEKPGKGSSQRLIRVLSERELVSFEAVAEDVTAAVNMRKEFILAVVDDEDELTYYEVRIHTLPEGASKAELPHCTGSLFGSTVIARTDEEISVKDIWFGTRFDAGRLMLSPLESLYLINKGLLDIGEDHIGSEELFDILSASDTELAGKLLTYTHLRNLGYIPRTAYKFGHHFRVYSGEKKHSEMLIHAMPVDTLLPMSDISRSVRLAHSVRKKMLFACVNQNTIQYIEFSRIKL